MEKHNKKALIAFPGTPSVQALLKEEAVRIGYHVSTFSSNERIWAFFEKENPSLVVLGDGDLKGIDLCRNIRAHNAGRYTTILVVSTVKQTRTEESYLKAGADNVLHISEDSTSVHGWIAAADRHATNLADLKQCSNKIESYQRELNFMNVQLEETLTHTNKLAVEAELAYLELDQIFKTAAGGILVIDKKSNVLRYNEAFLHTLHMTGREMKDKKCYEVFTTRLCHTPDCPLTQIQQGSMRVEHEVERMRKDGSTAFYMIISAPLRGPDADLIAVVSSIADITLRVEAEKALQKKEEQFRELSFIDDLTNLYNKRHLHDFLKSEIDRTIRYQHPLSLMLMDIDDFKQYNDTFGHTKGDQVLADIGKIISTHIRKSDSGFRYGGEEFVVVLPETQGKAAVNVAERIRKTFASTTFSPAGDERIQKTVSIGLTQYLPPESEEDLLVRADQNMYQAKRSGKNQVIFL